MREVIFAAVLLVSAALVVVGVCLLMVPVGLIVAGVLLAAWSWLVLSTSPSSAGES